MSESDSVLFNVDINNYNGPLDVLLDLAKAKRVSWNTGSAANTRETAIRILRL